MTACSDSQPQSSEREATGWEGTHLLTRLSIAAEMVEDIRQLLCTFSATVMDRSDLIGAIDDYDFAVSKV
jgi:hypothetical protein